MPTDVQISKSLSYWLRHAPDAGGIVLSSEGWADVNQVLAALTQNAMPVEWERLLEVVESSDKSRFELSADCTLIRARQGHSVEINGEWQAAAPPDYLYHGTVARFLPSIQADGLQRMKRHHVHLSSNRETARRVGERRGVPTILRVQARELAATGVEFFLTTNGVWLVAHVPPSYLEELSSS